MTVDHGFKFVEKFAEGISWYMMETKDIISDISFKLKNENGNSILFNGQNFEFGLSIREIKFFLIDKNIN